MRAVIVGGGVMGCSSAYALACRGVDVVVLERAVPGAEASSAAAGILGAQVELVDDPEFRARLVSARARYEDWTRELEAKSGVRTGYRRSGALDVAWDDREVEHLQRVVGEQRGQGLAAEWLDRAMLMDVEPGASPAALGAAYFPDDAQVDPPELLRSLVIACGKVGVETLSGTTVVKLDRDGDRCLGVVTSGGRVHGDVVVLAAGSWSSLVPGWPSSLPDVKPVRGQLIQLDERPPRLRTILCGRQGYVVPRGDGRVVCGSTMELVGHRREVTADGVHQILDRALALAPGLGAAEMMRAWCNFRPNVGDHLPLVGRCAVEGLVLATGHHRNGILLAQETGERVRDEILSPTRRA